jgi:hypothetical protein
VLSDTFIIILIGFRWEGGRSVKLMDFVDIPRTVSSKNFDLEMIGNGRTFDMIAATLHCSTLVYGQEMSLGPTDSGCQIFDDDFVGELIDDEQVK